MALRMAANPPTPPLTLSPTPLPAVAATHPPLQMAILMVTIPVIVAAAAAAIAARFRKRACSVLCMRMGIPLAAGTHSAPVAARDPDIKEAIVQGASIGCIENIETTITKGSEALGAMIVRVAVVVLARAVAVRVPAIRAQTLAQIQNLKGGGGKLGRSVFVFHDIFLPHFFFVLSERAGVDLLYIKDWHEGYGNAAE